jgi:5'-3' exonuclease
MKDNTRILDIFKNLKQKGFQEDRTIEPPTLNLNANSRILLVDGMNMFLRAFSVVNRVNISGNPVGGMTGFLRSLGAMIKLHNPTKVILAFDGERGSQARKYLYRPYKANRDNKKVINTKLYSSVEEEKGSKNDQITRLIDYLRCLPITMMIYDDLEADDIIAYLAKYIPETYPDSFTYIVSSDQDYMQLVNERVLVYSPTKKLMYDTHSVLSEYGIHPLNLNVYKALVGDNSDNLPGVSGVGDKTVAKLFEGLKEPETKGLEYIYETCEEKPVKSVLYDRILFVKKTVEIMYQIMDLHNPNIHPDNIEDIERLYHKKVPALDKATFMQLYVEDRLGDIIPYTNNWLECFKPLAFYKPK